MPCGFMLGKDQSSRRHRHDVDADDGVLGAVAGGGDGGDRVGAHARRIQRPRATAPGAGARHAAVAPRGRQRRPPWPARGGGGAGAGALARARGAEVPRVQAVAVGEVADGDPGPT